MLFERGNPNHTEKQDAMNRKRERTLVIDSAQWAGTRPYQNDVMYIGRKPKSNMTLLALADGLGTDAEAGKAATAVIDEIRSVFEQTTANKELHQIALGLLGQANRHVYHMNQSQLANGAATIGATAACVLLQSGRFSIASVGNVRVFLVRSGAVLQLNRDHLKSLEAEEEDILSGDEPDVTPAMAMMVTSYLGMEDMKKIDYIRTPIRMVSGDYVVLMSSGLYGVFPDPELVALLYGGPPQDAAKRVIERLQYLQPESQSNASLIVLSMEDNSSGRQMTYNTYYTY